MTDKLDIVLSQQQQQASQLVRLLERAGEHGGRLTALSKTVESISADLSVVRGHPSSCPARAGFVGLSRDVAQLQTATASHERDITETRLKSFRPTPSGGTLHLPMVGAPRGKKGMRPNLTTMLIYIITVAAAIAATLLGLNIQ